MSEFKEHLDGPRLVAWLEDRFPELEPDSGVNNRDIIGASGAARLFRWRKGVTAGVDAADKVCVMLGLVIDQDLPDDLWVDPPVKKVRKTRTWEHKRALEMLEEGYYPAEIGRFLGVDARTIRQWRWRANPKPRKAFAAKAEA